ncbi:MAG: hypothetical protein NT028_07250, partial [candidate division Zixibacteria bacterium]|nr:hypothetical protein [candidate division Zixibacteria bacterium]
GRGAGQLTGAFALLTPRRKGLLKNRPCQKIAENPLPSDKAYPILEKSLPALVSVWVGHADSRHDVKPPVGATCLAY